jgi:hypothetical protein
MHLSHGLPPAAAAHLALMHLPYGESPWDADTHLALPRRSSKAR